MVFLGILALLVSFRTLLISVAWRCCCEFESNEFKGKNKELGKALKVLSKNGHTNYL